MKKTVGFLKKILVLLLLFCLFDYLSGIALQYFFYKQKSGKYYTTLYGFKSANEAIMIFGDSHANEQFDAPLMEQKLKLSTFNFGIQGLGLLYQYPLIKATLQHARPAVVIITLNYNSLQYVKQDYQRLSIFLPFKGLNPYVDSAIGSISENELYKSYSSFYKYNSTLAYMLMKSFYKSYNKSYESRGFDPTPGTICNQVPATDNDNIQHTKSKNDFRIDSLKLQHLTNIIDELNARKIKTIFIATPLYDLSSKGVDDDLYFGELQKLFNSKGAIFWDLSQDSNFFKKCELYHDTRHLNEVGAKLFTESIIEKIKPML